MDHFAKYEPVQLVVGPEKQDFWVNPNVLRQAKFFEKALDSGFAESHSRVINMPEDSPHTMYYVLQWMHHSKLPPSGNCGGITILSDDKDGKLLRLCKIWVLADKLDLRSLTEAVERAVRESLARIDSAPGVPMYVRWPAQVTSDDVVFLYENTTTQCGMRQIIA